MGLFGLSGGASFSNSDTTSTSKPILDQKFLQKFQSMFPMFNLSNKLGGAGAGGFSVGAPTKSGAQAITSGLPQFQSLVDKSNPQQFQQDLTQSLYKAGEVPLLASEEDQRNALNADLQKRGLANSPAAFAAGSPVDQFNKRALNARSDLAAQVAPQATQLTIQELARATGLDMELLNALFNISGSQSEFGLASAGRKTNSSTSGSTVGGSGGFGF